MAASTAKVIPLHKGRGGKKSNKAIYRHGPDPEMARVLEAVDESGMTDKAVIAKTRGMALSTISRMRRGVTQHAQHVTLAEIARAIGPQCRWVRSNRP